LKKYLFPSLAKDIFKKSKPPYYGYVFKKPILKRIKERIFKNLIQEGKGQIVR
jgi:RNA processing factor Prp31